MKEIDISSYVFQGAEYSVRESLLAVIFSPHLKLNSRELFEMSKIATKIESATGNFIDLEDAEYERVLHAVETFEGYNRQDTEFVSRVVDSNG